MIRPFLAAAALATALAGTPAHAMLLLEFDGTPTAAAMIANTPTAQSIQVTAWTFDQAVTGIEIAAVLARTTLPNVLGHAWLTTAIGPGTPASAVLAQSNFAVPYYDPIDFDPAPSWVTVFSGLALDAGTYYLTLGSSSGTAGWFDAPGATRSFAPGVHYVGFDFSVPALGVDIDAPYASNFGSALVDLDANRLWRITGEVRAAAVPEPASVALLAGALLALCAARRRHPSTIQEQQ